MADFRGSIGYRATDVVINGVYEFDQHLLFGLMVPDWDSHQELIIVDGVYEFGIRQLFECFPQVQRMPRRRNEGRVCHWKYLLQFGHLERCVDSEDKLSCVSPLTGKTITIYQDSYGKKDYRSTLEELTDDCWPEVLSNMLSELMDLQHLKFLSCVDPIYREAIEALDLRTDDVNYSDVPSVNSPIHRLDTTCLDYLQGSLSTDQWNWLKEGTLCLKISKFTMDDSFLPQLPWPTYAPLYAMLGTTLTNLEISQFCRVPLYELLPNFVNLTELKINKYIPSDMVGKVLKVIPSGLRAFSWDTHSRPVPQPEFTDLLRRLNPTLRVLYISCMDVDSLQSLSKLTNIQDFECPYMRVASAFYGFLNLNKAHMRRLVVGNPRFSTDEAEDFFSLHFIAQMDNLQNLQIDTNLYDVSGIRGGCLPKLWKLTIRAAEGFQELLDLLDGSSLIDLRITGCNEQIDAQSILRFRQLRTLKFYSALDPLLLVMGLPHLVRLDVLKADISAESVRKICSFLRRACRNLTIVFSDGLSIKFFN